MRCIGPVSFDFSLLNDQNFVSLCLPICHTQSILVLKAHALQSPSTMNEYLLTIEVTGLQPEHLSVIRCELKEPILEGTLRIIAFWTACAFCAIRADQGGEIKLKSRPEPHCAIFGAHIELCVSIAKFTLDIKTIGRAALSQGVGVSILHVSGMLCECQC